MPDARIFIAVPVHNRLAIAKACLPTIRAGMEPLDTLALYNDGSDFRGVEAMRFFNQFTGAYRENHPAIGIEAQRRQHILEFANLAPFYNFTHLYLTDPDALHDPAWRHTALRLQAEHDHAPLCLYNTLEHANLPGNTLEDDPASEVIWRKHAPGISFLLTRAHVETIMPRVSKMEHFDWQIPEWLGHRFATTVASYVDHIGEGGMHHPKGAGLDGGDRALNPTPWLVAKRAEVVALLRQGASQRATA